MFINIDGNILLGSLNLVLHLVKLIYMKLAESYFLVLIYFNLEILYDN